MEQNSSFIAHCRISDNAEQSVAQHLQETHDLAKVMAAKINLADAGALIGLLHDFGKYSNAFQVYIKSATGKIDPDNDDFVDPIRKKGRVDHSTAGAKWVRKILLDEAKTKLELADKSYFMVARDMLAICIASHHGGLIDCQPTFGGYKGLDVRLNKTNEETHLSTCIEQADKSIKSQALALAKGDLIVQMVEWLKRIDYATYNNLPLSLYKRTFYQGMLIKFLFSCLIDADRMSSADFETPQNKDVRSNSTPDWHWACERVESFITGLKVINPIDKLRQTISNRCKARSKDKQGIYSLTVPTGGGKTFASLRYGLHHAKTHRLDRIIYVIPYTSIIDQNAKAIRNALNVDVDSPWVLECHSNLEPEEQTWRSKLVSENWDAPIVLVTMVQLLEMFFAGGTRSIRKLHQLANSVVIFDEIQTLPVNCVHMFCNAINFMSAYAGTTALMCTATQPLLGKLDKPEFGQLHFSPNHELMADTTKLFADLKRVEVVNKMRDGGWSVDELSQFALSEVEHKGSCLVIVNTKAWAKDLFEAVNIDAANAEVRVIHLSTAQCPAHRKVLLAEVVERLAKKLPTICISTQLIEAGVDVDFKTVVRFNAGLDSIAQAAGRCNRNGKHQLGQVFVVNPNKESTSRLIDIDHGKCCTKRVIRQVGTDNLLSPQVMAKYFEHYFYERHECMTYQIVDKGGKDNLLNLLSTNCTSESSAKTRLRPAFMTAGKLFKAIDTPTQAVLVPYGEGQSLITELCSISEKFEPATFKQTLKKLQQYSVNLFPNVFEQLQETKALDELKDEKENGLQIYILNERFYSDDFGVSDREVNSMAFLGC